MPHRPVHRSLSAPGDGEGWGEVGDTRALADAHLTLPHLGVGSSLSPLKGGEEYGSIANDGSGGS